MKNPDYPDTLYVTDLVVADTVNTMPEKTLEAFADHGEVDGDQVTGRAGEAQALFDQLTEVGVDLDDVFVVLETEGVDKFKKSWVELRGDRQGSDGPTVDPTTTARVGRLGDLAAACTPDLRASFADDPGRVDRLTFEAADLHVDLSKNLVDDEILGRPARPWPRRSGSPSGATRCSRGEHINVTEDRAVLHTALRAPGRRRRSRSTARTSSPTCTRSSSGSTRSPSRCAPESGPASPASGSARSSTSASAAPTSAR